jgi:hypothetical protein
MLNCEKDIDWFNSEIKKKTFYKKKSSKKI